MGMQSAISVLCWKEFQDCCQGRIKQQEKRANHSQDKHLRSTIDCYCRTSANCQSNNDDPFSSDKWKELNVVVVSQTNASYTSIIFKCVFSGSFLVFVPFDLRSSQQNYFLSNHELYSWYRSSNVVGFCVLIKSCCICIRRTISDNNEGIFLPQLILWINMKQFLEVHG